MRGGGVAGESQGIPVVALVRDHSDTGFWHCGRLFAQLQMPSLQNLKEFLVTPPFTPNIFLLPPPHKFILSVLFRNIKYLCESSICTVSFFMRLFTVCMQLLRQQ